MSHTLVLAISLAGFVCLALSMNRHQRDEFGRALSARMTWWLRWLGWVLVTLALPVAIIGLGTGFGIVAWNGHISLAATVVFVGLLARSRRREIKG
ncbi:DUF3325 domain-containing protein [Paracoccus sp. 12-3]|nr:DUF3325 domain-containing protein [Paracoccus xiamenensis]